MGQFRCHFCEVHAATLHITRIESSKVYTIHVCPKCAHEHGLSNPIHSSPLVNLLQDPSEAAQSVEDAGTVEEASCRGCGKTYSNFQETGKMGCGECYETFSDALEPLLRRIQRDSHHAGKVPRRADRRIRIEADLRALQAELNEAVRSEDFERAAQIRDRIRELTPKEQME